MAKSLKNILFILCFLYIPCKAAEAGPSHEGPDSYEPWVETRIDLLHQLQQLPKERREPAANKALALAAENNDLPFACFCLKMGAKLDDVVRQPLAVTSSPSVAHLLLKHGADPGLQAQTYWLIHQSKRQTCSSPLEWPTIRNNPDLALLIAPRCQFDPTKDTAIDLVTNHAINATVFDDRPALRKLFKILTYLGYTTERHNTDRFWQSIGDDLVKKGVIVGFDNAETTGQAMARLNYLDMHQELRATIRATQKESDQNFTQHAETTLDEFLGRHLRGIVKGYVGHSLLPDLDKTYDRLIEQAEKDIAAAQQEAKKLAEQGRSEPSRCLVQ